MGINNCDHPASDGCFHGAEPSQCGFHRVNAFFVSERDLFTMYCFVVGYGCWYLLF